MPLITGKPPNEKVIAKSMRNVNNCLDQIETLWLRDNQFICGQEVTIADIFAACEIEQPRKYNRIQMFVQSTIARAYAC